MIPYKVGMLDFDLKRSVLSASVIMALLSGLMIAWPVITIIVCMVFTALSIFVSISMLKDKGFLKSKGKGLPEPPAVQP